MSVPKIAVIGAGVAGAMAARRLTDAGLKVTVFERDDYIGGRARTVREGGFTFDTGAVGLLGSYQRTKEVAHEIGMAEQFLTLRPVGAIPRDGVLRYLDMSQPIWSFLRSDLFSFRSKVLLVKLAAKIMRLHSILDYEQVDALIPHDIETVQSYALRELNAELYEYLAGTLTRGAWLAPAEQASVIQFLWTAKNFTPHMYSLMGGMDSLPKRLLDGIDVRLETTALNVEEEAKAVKVTVSDASGEQTLAFDGCVIAVPPVPILKMFPQVAGEQRDYLEGVSYSRSVNVHFGLAKRPKNPAMYIMVPKRECADITTIFLDHHKAPDRAPPGKGVISVFLRSEWCAARYETNQDAVLSEVLGKLRPYFGDLESSVERSVVQRWGSCALMITPGIFRLMSGYKRATNPKARVQLAGDFAQFSSVNTAVVSGERAANRMAAQFEHEVRPVASHPVEVVAG